MIGKYSLAAIMILASIGSASAHAHLKRSEPAEDAVLKKLPKVISIEYSEALEAGLSKLVILDAQGKAVATDKPDYFKGNHKTLSVHPPVLKPGTYKVEWGAASVDTHRTEGSFTFKIVP